MANPYDPTANPYAAEPPQQRGTPDDLMDGPQGDSRMLDLEPPNVEGQPLTTRPRQKPSGGSATEMAAVTQASKRSDMIQIICRGCNALGEFDMSFVASLADPGVEAVCEGCGSEDLDLATEADLKTTATTEWTTYSTLPGGGIFHATINGRNMEVRSQENGYYWLVYDKDRPIGPSSSAQPVGPPHNSKAEAQAAAESYAASRTASKEAAYGAEECEVCGKPIAMQSGGRGYVHWTTKRLDSDTPTPHNARPKKKTAANTESAELAFLQWLRDSGLNEAALLWAQLPWESSEPESEGFLYERRMNEFWDAVPYGMHPEVRDRINELNMFHLSKAAAVKKLADFGGLSTDLPMDTLDHGSGYRETLRCSSCFNVFERVVHGADVPMPTCPRCQSQAVAIFPKAAGLNAAFASLITAASEAEDGPGYREVTVGVERICSVCTVKITKADDGSWIDSTGRDKSADHFHVPGGTSKPKEAAREDHKDDGTGKCAVCGGQFPCAVVKADKRLKDWEDSTFPKKQSKLAEIVAGILQTNPSMDRTAARTLAEKVVSKYPKLAAYEECPKCGENNHGEASRCAHCGAVLPETPWGKSS